ncbi:SCO1860 family LAETG-anchored protein [Streptomyces avicenniae]|uniref:SCO1860 family LAETG-anchored protein n=1 Tax=Streptomyces avicenniae TaxID=500153 RepID=UPI000699C8A5|nr:SCO1860 family LAETG-anchored protein [Streptomyces avicenniae]
MSNSAFRRPTAAAVATAAALLGALAPAAVAADDTPDGGTANAAVLRTGLNVALLNRTLELPLSVALNEVAAPDGGGTADETLLTATLDGVAGGDPFELLRAEVASATATSDPRDGASAEVSLVNARVHLPGLPGAALVEADVVGASAVCATGEAPTADVTMPAALTVLGQRVELSATGSTVVDVPGVGEVTLDLSRTETTEADASAAALRLAVDVNPLNLNVAEVTGELTLAEAACTSPAATEEPGGEEPEQPGGEEPGEEPGTEAPPADGEGTRPQTGGGEETGPDLAETGGGSGTPLMVGGAAALLAAGAATVWVTRRRRSA